MDPVCVVCKKTAEVNKGEVKVFLCFVDENLYLLFSDVVAILRNNDSKQYIK